MYYRDDKLGLSEFCQVFKESIDSFNITSLSHIQDFESFYEEIAFKMFDVYQRSEHELSVRDLVIPFHIFLSAMFKYKPSVEKNEDEIKIVQK